MPRTLIHVVLADDHPVFRHGVTSLIADSGEIVVVASVETGAAAYRAIVQHEPDVAILDINMPEMNGVTVLRHLARTGTRTQAIMLSVYESRVYIDQAFEAGARGYVLKRSAFQNIASAVRAVHAGGIYLDPALPERTAPHRRLSSSVDEAACSTLSERERDILRFVAFGFTSKEVADRLGATPKAIETQKARACTKLGLASRAQIVQFAILQGWLHGEIPLR
ncbi:response regulator transcription factor [Methylorubrum extorquens]|jgi:DNA-binding NarL/FixJ family response regulator|uniref:Two-component transcriptional regulator, LuxR family n=5 Tax=Methylorubrum extorquens TaxID=408 RepID=C5B0C2_METEA|nr:response regulator transcription factor [Methylorubrum extorquens]ARO55472.1 DNA-binding response regulator [Methylorubrum zatmanii]KQP93483.1 two-component system response regulator [Methylobacterium sp. Leaf119]KQP97129.1 two-component system response regulator [Methylobacterium sp. Leaf121]MDF9866058.1 DNA-binding NarL/FixJ family response regulator [Methylorubrum pseudosasae]MDH6639610.1 DNA-binding NarL/FixJ family response regulator [Methylobacterium sp. SuP10 SLI 274]CAX23938.1 two-